MTLFAEMQSHQPFATKSLADFLAQPLLNGGVP
jgi:hypothetical protein